MWLPPDCLRVPTVAVYGGVMRQKLAWRNILARDNFSKAIIETLKARVAHRCSNPDCRVPTSAPSSNDKVNSIGIAAHICAASQEALDMIAR